jgi:hypothetical protein
MARAARPAIIVETKPRNLESYIAPNDTVPFDEWLRGLRDRLARTAIDQRLNRPRIDLQLDESISNFLKLADKPTLEPGYRADDGESVLLYFAPVISAVCVRFVPSQSNWKEYRS